MWCVDAALQGIAVMRSEWPPRCVAEFGRQEERWRFKLTDKMELGPTEGALSETTLASCLFLQYDPKLPSSLSKI